VVPARTSTAPPHAAPDAPERRTGGLRATIVREAGKFGVIGGVAFVIDVGLFNLLRFGVLGAGGWLEDKPLTAKVLSMGTATLAAWAGNRWWTFRAHRAAGRSHRLLPELALYVTMNGIALGISLLCLGVSHYLLGLRSPVADNVSANIVGVGLGTLFRFYAYRRWVFRRHPGQPADAVVPAAIAAAAGVTTTDPSALTTSRPLDVGTATSPVG